MAGFRTVCGCVAAALLALTTPAFAQSAPKWGPHIDFEGKLGNDRELGEADAFVPLLQNRTSMLFGNVRTRMDTDTGGEGNFGLGVRHMLDAGWNLGAYGYFDRRRTENHNYFSQTTWGVEALSMDWDLRANYYAPAGRRSHQVDKLTSVAIEGTSVVFRGGEERSLGGFDGEIGWRVPVFDRDSNQQLRIFGGAYRFYDEGIDKVQGPRARAELTFDEVPYLWDGSRFTLGGEVQDDVRGRIEFLTARLRVPLQVFDGAKVASLSPMERRMADPIVRDVDIVSRGGAFGSPEVVTQTAAGQPLTVISSASTTGADLPTAITNAGANSTVIVQGNFNTTGTITLNNGQTVMGSGQIVIHSVGGKTGILTTGGGTINGSTTSNNGAIQMTNNSTLNGLTVSNTINAGATTVYAVTFQTNSINTTISNSTVTATNNSNGDVNAIFTLGAQNITIQYSDLFAQATDPTVTTNAINLQAGLTTSMKILQTKLKAQGGATNNHTFLNDQTGGITIQTGSTGNTNLGGNCATNGTITGLFSFIDGSTCP